MSSKPTKEQRDEIFCQELLRGSTQRKAYLKAYPNSKKWKDKTVDTRAWELAVSSEVKGRLSELRKKAEKETIITHNMITEELAKISFFDIAELFDKNGNLKNVHDMSETARKTISSIKVRREVSGHGEDKEVHFITEVKLNGKDQSIDKLSKHVGYYEKDNEQSAPKINKITVKFED